MQALIRCILLSVVITGAALAIVAQEPQPGTGSISGHVSVGGKPARGIAVIFLYEGKDKNDEPRSFADIFKRIHRIISGEDGSFRLDNLAAGRYQVATYTPAMIGALPSPAAKDPDEEKNSDNASETGGANRNTTDSDTTHHVINLQDGEKVEDVNFTLVRGGVITGRVTYEDGSPAIGIAIQVADAQGNGRTINGLNLEFDSTPIRTDDRGIYRVYGLADGRYKVSAGGKEGESAQTLSSNRYRRRTYYPNVTEVAGATAIEVSKGSEARDVDIKFGEPMKSYTVTGRVIEADTGNPVPRVPVSFASQNPGDSPPGNNYAVSNARGEFKFEGVPSGKYSILSPRTSQSADGTTSANEYYSPVSKFEVQDGDVRGVTLKLQHGLVLAGSIVFEGGDGALPQVPDLRLYAGVQSLQTNPEEAPLTTSGFAMVNADGSFILRGLSPGRASFALNSADNDVLRFQIIRIEANNVIDGQYIILNKGDSVTNARIFVAAANCMVKGQVKIEGTLPKGAEISVYARKVSTTHSQTDSESDNESETTPDANGNFVLMGLLAGPYEIIAEVVIGYTKDGQPITRQVKQLVTATPGQEPQVMLVLNVGGKAGDQ